MYGFIIGACIGAFAAFLFVQITLAAHAANECGRDIDVCVMEAVDG